MDEDRIGIHAARALAEIDLARAAPSPASAQAHLALSELHLERVRDLRTAQSLGSPTISCD